MSLARSSRVQQGNTVQSKVLSVYLSAGSRSNARIFTSFGANGQTRVEEIAPFSRTTTPPQGTRVSKKTTTTTTTNRKRGEGGQGRREDGDVLSKAFFSGRGPGEEEEEKDTLDDPRPMRIGARACT